MMLTITWFTYVRRIIEIVNLDHRVIFYKNQLVMTQGSKRMHRSLVENAFSFIAKIPVDLGLVKNTLSFVINIPVDRRPSELHSKNRNASDSYESCDIQLCFVDDIQRNVKVALSWTN